MQMSTLSQLSQYPGCIYLLLFFQFTKVLLIMKHNCLGSCFGIKNTEFMKIKSKYEGTHTWKQKWESTENSQNLPKIVVSPINSMQMLIIFKNFKTLA